MDSVPGRDFPYLHHEANFCSSPDLEERPTSLTYPYLSNPGQFSNPQPAPGFPYQRYDASQNLDSLRSATNHPHPLLFSGSHTPEASKEEQAVSQLGNLASSKLVPNSTGGIDLSSTSLHSAHLKHGALGPVGGVPHSSVTDNLTKVSSCYSPYFGSYNNHQEIQQATLNQLAEGLSYLQQSRHFSEEVFPPHQGGENLPYVMGRTVQGHLKDGGSLGGCQEAVDSMASKDKILSPSFYRLHEENFTKQGANKGLTVERKSMAAKLSHLRGHNTQTSQQSKSMPNTLNLSQGRSPNCKVKFILKGNLARPYPLLINNPKPFVDYSFEPLYQCDATLYADDVSFMDSGVQHFWPYHDPRRKLTRPTNHQGEFPSASYCEGEEEDVSSNPLDFLRDFVLNEKGQLNNSDLKKLKQKLHQPFAITSPSFNKATAPAVMTTTVTDNATMVTISIANKKQGAPARTTTVDSGIQNVVQTSNQNKNSPDKSKVLPKGRKEGKENQNEPVEQNSKSDKEENKDRLEINIRIDDSQLVQCGDQKRWQCHLCEKSYTTKHNLVTHILDHNGIKPHLCMVCGKYFKQLSHLNTHMLTHDNVKPHVCSICSKSFTQVSHLKRHQAVHLSEQLPHRCDTCGMGFAFPEDLQIHKEKHEKGEENRCSECGEEFDSQRALKLHMGYHRNFPNLVCKYCNKYFRYPSQLKDHLLSHEGARPYICSECGMDFYKEHHLKVHEYTHSGKKPWECPHCGRCFNQKANMQRHLLIHNAERKYKCETCGKTFTQPQTLKAHMVVHAEKKPFECQFCGKQFGRLHNLQGHLHMHNNSKPYICFCGSSFTLRGNLNRHKKVKHGLNESIESTENLEEEAVSFLNELSDRTRPESEATVRGQEGNLSETINSETDDEKDSDQSNSRTPRKARKSIPRKYTYKRRTHQDVSEDNNSEEEKDTEINEDEEKSPEEKKKLRVKKRKKFEPERVYASDNEGDGDQYNPGQGSASKAARKRKA
ncbi:GDNF-inducible zinc finger protein 1-like [Saccostrea cucullata]|uniref:GDNF-inducible zinc finger protein 1-like n=1 Tax=Saccostrea cuccullata TaxID=36930 RepID=UPI002ED12193